MSAIEQSQERATKRARDALRAVYQQYQIELWEEDYEEGDIVPMPESLDPNECLRQLNGAQVGQAVEVMCTYSGLPRQVHGVWLDRILKAVILDPDKAREIDAIARGRR